MKKQTQKPGSDSPSAIDKDTWNDLSKSTPMPSVKEASVPRSTTANVSRPIEGSVSIKGLRLLLVDDDPSQLDLLANGLREFGAEVHLGDRKESGYRLAIQVKPDAVISDLTSPGEPGWWLVQRLRRHALMRWTPVLLLRWWDPTSGVRIDRVLERLEELFAPLRVIEERIAVGKSLSDRVEISGVPVLLRLFTQCKLTGLFTVNDTWSIFEVTMKKGLEHSRITSVVRRGVEGGSDRGMDAFVQLLLCDGGRWSFRSSEVSKTETNLEGTLDKILDRAEQTLSALFGPQADRNARTADRLRVNLEVLADVASPMSNDAKAVAHYITSGLRGPELNTLLAKRSGPVSVERVLLSFIRCGAIQPLSTPTQERRDSKQLGAARAVSRLLDDLDQANSEKTELKTAAVGMAHGPTPGPENGQGEYRKTKTLGSYQVSEVAPERLAASRRENLKVPGVSPGSGQVAALQGEMLETETIPVEDSVELKTLREEAAAKSRAEREPGAAWEQFVQKTSGEVPKHREKLQMWVAILLAILLGAALITGLVWIGGYDRGGRPEIPSGP